MPRDREDKHKYVTKTEYLVDISVDGQKLLQRISRNGTGRFGLDSVGSQQQQVATCFEDNHGNLSLTKYGLFLHHFRV